MTEKHPIRNAVAVTVISSVILAALGYLWPPAQRVLIWLWGALLSLWAALIETYAVPGWLLLVLSLAALLVLARAVTAALSRRASPPRHLSYTSDDIFGARWHWAWGESGIVRLWASCPKCQGELVYLTNNDAYFMPVQHAQFFCENCQKVVVDVTGGGHDYAISAVEREIRRRLRVAAEASTKGAS